MAETAWDFGPGNLGDPGVDYWWESSAPSGTGVTAAGLGSGFMDLVKTTLGYNLARNQQQLLMQQNALGQRYMEGRPVAGQAGGGSPLLFLLLVGGLIVLAKD